MTDLVMYRGDDRDFPLTITVGGGTAVDLTGATVVFTAREALDDTEPTFTLTSANGGVTIAADQTAEGDRGLVTVHVPTSATVDFTEGLTLLCDVEVTESDGDVFTWPEPDFDGSTLIRLRVRADVTQP